MALTLLICLALWSGHSAMALAPPLEDLTTLYWDWRMMDAPEFASFVGVREYEEYLDDMSLEAYEIRYNQSGAFMKMAEDIEGDLTADEDLVNLQIFKKEMQTFMSGYPFKSFLMPLNYMEGVHVDFERLISWMVFETSQDFERLLSRFEKLPTQLQQIQQLMEAGVAQGIVNHAIAMKGVVDTLGRFVVVKAEDSPLWERFTSFPDSFSPDLIASLQDQARDLIVNQISPAFEVLQAYVRDEYTTRDEIAVTTLPNGREFYDELLRFHTSTGLTAVEIHEMGLEEVARIEGEMAKIVAELGYNMTVPEFSAMIRNDSSFYYENGDDLLAGFQDLCYNVIPPKVPDFFMNIPVTELEVKADPSPDGPGAFYLAGSFDGSRPGIFYVNTYIYDAQPKYAMRTLSLHEGNPGHHLQGSHSLESPNMPYFRRAMEDRNYYQAPSRYPMNTAFIEGWGLYSESLGFDMELFGDPYDRYGHYSDEIFRACRLVVDTGMHALSWTRQEAIDFMFGHTAMGLVDVENEIDRYITWPGQAVSYKVGQMKITELRTKATLELGDAFDIKKFHDIALDSVGPLDVLEGQINAWIASGGGAKGQK